MGSVEVGILVFLDVRDYARGSGDVALFLGAPTPAFGTARALCVNERPRGNELCFLIAMRK